MSDSKPCPQCGGPLPQDGALGGGCPRCMLELGFETSAGTTRRSEPGTPAERLAIIGRYRILRLIGEGGMGAVYEAEQDHPRRTVALKIIKTGMASPELLRRFEQESQALGRLQHPGIAQIYEAGTLDTGFGPQPYFAMELIRGRSPRDYAEEHHLNARERLQMMVKICDAVHHAHQRGLIHRDLKPGNILVDQTGQPKILDFGVARVTDSDARATLQTDMGQLIGTLAYMSPEQALADPMDLDTRTDVYSLGVILYELLSGRLPYTVSKKVHEAIQSIREEDPARLSSSNRTYRGDIETIVAKALEKERDRRYASAAEMAADIQRYLNDEPIIARRPSASYQLQKFARRNKALVTGVAAVFVVLVAEVTVVTWYAARVTKERDRAVKAEEQARQEGDRAWSAEQATSIALDRAVTAEEQVRGERDLAIQAQNRSDTNSATSKAILDFLREYMLTFPDPRNGTPLAVFVKPNPNLTIREALDRAAASIAGKFDTLPLVEAALRETIAQSYLSLGLYADGQLQLEHAIEVRRKAQGWAHPDSLKTLKALVEQKRRANSNAPEVEGLLREIVDIESRVLGIENPQTMMSMENLVRFYHFDLKYSEEEALLMRIIAIRSRTTDTPDLTSVTRLIYLIEASEKQGKARQSRQHTETLEAAFRRLGEKNDITQSGLGLLFTFYLDNYPERPEAEALFRRIEATSLSRIASMPDREALPGMIGMVQVYQQLGKSEQANQLSARVEARIRALGARNPTTILAINNFRLRTRRSLPDLVDLVNAALPEPGKETLGDIPTIREVAMAYYDQGKYLDAENLYTRALETSNRLLAKEDPDSLAVRMVLAGVYVLEGKLDIAEKNFNELLVINRRTSGPEERTTLLTMTLLGWTRLHQQRYTEVEVDLREVLHSLEKVQPDEWERYNCQSILGASLAGQKRYADAEPLLLSAYAGMMSRQSTVARTYPIRPKLQEEAGMRIVQLYKDWGKPEEAAKWRERLRVAEERALREPPRK